MNLMNMPVHTLFVKEKAIFEKMETRKNLENLISVAN